MPDKSYSKVFREVKERERRKIKRALILIQVFLIAIAVVFAYYVFGNFIRIQKLYVDKPTLLNKLEIAISKGAQLDDVKQIFDNRENFRESPFRISSQKDFKAKGQIFYDGTYKA